MLKATMTLAATSLETKLKVDCVSMLFSSGGKTVPVLDNVSMEARGGRIRLHSRPFGNAASRHFSIS